MGKQWKQWLTLFLGVPKSLQMVTGSHEIKTPTPWKESYDQPRQHIKKQRHYFADKGPSSQGYGFSSGHVWTVKKAECRRIDAFELWCWRRLLRVLWTARRSNQSILKEISPKYSLEGLMLKLKLILWPPDKKNWLIWKDTDAGEDWRQRRRGWQRMRWLDGITDSMNISFWVSFGSWQWTRRPGVLQSMGSQRIGHKLVDWTELMTRGHYCHLADGF